MASIIFNFLFLNFLLSLSASFDPSSGVADNDFWSALRDMARKRSGRQEWQKVSADINRFPFHAIVVVNKNNPILEKICTGSIISDKVVLTSGSCLCNMSKIRFPLFPLSQYEIYVGSTDVYDLITDTLKYNVEKITMYSDFYDPHYNPNFPKGQMLHDLAAIRIKGSLITNKNPHVKTVIIAERSSDEFYSGLAFGLLTFKRNKTGQAIFKNLRMSLYVYDLKPQSEDTCQEMLAIQGWQPNPHYDTICAIANAPQSNFAYLYSFGNDISLKKYEKSSIEENYFEYGYPICMNDHGGGMIYPSNYQLFAVASTFYGCNKNFSVLTFTRIGNQDAFMIDVLSDEKVTNSRADFLHNKLFTKNYGAPLTSLSLLPLFLKSGFY